MPLSELHGNEVTRLGKRHVAQDVHIVANPRGETQYWIGAAGAVKDGAPGTDFHATAQNKVSITPLQIDLTGFEAIADANDLLKGFSI